MEILIILLLVISYFAGIVIIIAQYLYNKDLHHNLELKNNSIKEWLDMEVTQKRTYSKLSEALILDRDEYRNKYLSLSKKYNRLNRYIKSFIKWKMSIDILISKIK